MLYMVHGEALRCLRMFPKDCVDLFFTSPPYADRRKRRYVGIPQHLYADWFVSIAEEMLRVLSPSGSFVLNICEQIDNGVKEYYVDEVKAVVRDLGWFHIETYIWAKTNFCPGDHGPRLHPSYEYLFHFSKSKTGFVFNREAGMRPAKENTVARSRVARVAREKRFESSTGSGMGVKRAAWNGRGTSNGNGNGKVMGTNVISGPTETSNVGHSAAFPLWLPELFIRLLTNVGDFVVDPFAGSATTLIASHENGRRALGIDLDTGPCSSRLRGMTIPYRLVKGKADPTFFRRIALS